jgi:voltage-gated potassium channel
MADPGLSQTDDLRGHFVVMGWKPGMHLLIRELLAAHPALGARRLVLINSAGEETNAVLCRDFEGLRHIQGELTDPLVLRRASIATAVRAFVLADATGSRSDQEIDARTVMALMNIENLAPNVYTYAELLDRQYVEYLRLAHCDEIILSREYGRFMLVSASASAGVSQALLELMDILDGGGLASVAIPEELVGRTFGELAGHFRAKDGGLLIGLIESTGQPLTIKRNALREAQKTANVGVLVENLRRVNGLTPNRPVLNPRNDYVVAAQARALVVPRPGPTAVSEAKR